MKYIYRASHCSCLSIMSVMMIKGGVSLGIIVSNQFKHKSPFLYEEKQGAFCFLNVHNKRIRNYAYVVNGWPLSHCIGALNVFCPG